MGYSAREAGASQTLEASPAASATDSKAFDTLQKLVAQMGKFSSSPAVLPPLLQALAEEDTDLERVADLITIDPGLTARLLSICNSAAFGRRMPVDSVAEAIQLLGFQTVYRMAAAAAGGGAFKPGTAATAELAAKLWRHAVTTAFAAQFVAQDIGADPSLCFTVGLLHNIGRAALMNAFSNVYGHFLAETERLEALERKAAERKEFGVDYCDVGGELLKWWRFSPGFVAVVANHLEPSRLEEPQPQKLAACVSLASLLGRKVAANETLGAELPVAADRLNLSALDLTRYEELLLENIKYVDSMCRVR